MKTLSATQIPRPSSPSRSMPGRSQEQVARALSLSVAEVASIERLALAKCRREFERRGLSLADFLTYFQP